MGTKTLTLDELLDVIRDGIAMTGTPAAYADFAGISLAAVNACLAGRRKPPKKLLDYLGLEAVVVYRRKETRRR